MNLKLLYGLFLSLTLLSWGCGTKKSVTNSNTTPESSSEKFTRSYIGATSSKSLGNIEEAIKQFNRCLVLIPNSHAVQYQLAQIYKDNSKYDSALMFIKKALIGDSKNKWYRELGADLYWINRDRKTSTEMYERLIKDFPGTRVYYDRLRNMYRRMANKNLEISLVKKKIGYFGTDKNSLIQLESLLTSTGKRKEAVKLWTDQIKVDPNDLTSYKRLGNLYFKAKDNKNASIYFKKGMALANGEESMIKSYIHFLKSNDFHHQLDSLYSSLLEDNSISLVLKKYLFDNTANNAQKLKIGDQILKSGDVNNDLLESVGLMHYKVGHFNEANIVLSQIDVVNSMAIGEGLINSRLQLGLEKDAFNIIEQLKVIFPFNQDLRSYQRITEAMLYSDSISSYYAKNEFDFERNLLPVFISRVRSGKAIKTSNANLNYTSKDLMGLYYLGKELLKKGLYKEAEYFVFRAIKIEPNGTLYELMGDIYSGQGLPNKAKSQWDLAQKLGWDNPLFLKKLMNEK